MRLIGLVLRYRMHRGYKYNYSQSKNSSDTIAVNVHKCTNPATILSREYQTAFKECFKKEQHQRKKRSTVFRSFNRSVDNK